MFNQGNNTSRAPLCEFCGVNIDINSPLNEHDSSCPLLFISPENVVGFVGEPYLEAESHLTNEDIERNLGAQLMLSSDAILNAQRAWANKSLMQKFDEVLNRYTELTSFVVALRDVGVLKTMDDVIDFLIDPSAYDDVFSMWIEFGSPQQALEIEWQMFTDTLNSKGWIQKTQP